MIEEDDACAHHSCQLRTLGTGGRCMTTSSHCCAWITQPGTQESPTLGVEDISLKPWQQRPHLRFLCWGRISPLPALTFSPVREWAGQIDTLDGKGGSVKRLGTKSTEGSRAWSELIQKTSPWRLCAELRAPAILQSSPDKHTV